MVFVLIPHRKPKILQYSPPQHCKQQVIFWHPRCSDIAFDHGLVSFRLTLSLPSTTKVPNASSLDQDETPSYQDPSCLTPRQHFHQLWATLKHFENWSRQKFSRQHIYLTGHGLTWHLHSPVIDPCLTLHKIISEKILFQAKTGFWPHVHVFCKQFSCF